ncbi:MAG: 2-C-methyl-D-erythritol 4-phosphate cytidylyltransferase [Firmicutes bacterium]|nr:2-C-methyl-D-erythritol 4-phosphate cytidylyltransferase [Bacillota bacterium]
MYSAVIVGAGSGMRTGLEYNKMFYLLKGKSMICYSVEVFLKDIDCEQIIVVTNKIDYEKIKNLFLDLNVKIVIGGETRQESVYLGLSKVKTKYVFIHDGARPNIKIEQIDQLKEALKKKNALTLGIRVKDTLKQTTNLRIVGDVDRNSVYTLQTPQVFITQEIIKAHELANQSKHTYSDDTSVYRSELHKDVFIVPGREDNLKGTTLIDLIILEALLC